MDIIKHNRDAWNRHVDTGNRWTVAVTTETIQAARNGKWSILLTPTIPVPRDWFIDLPGAQVLCLASGGGQQGPILAAAGATVTVFDNSPKQLKQDQLVAEREGLTLDTIKGDMADLSVFPDGQFDMIFHPISNVFVPNVLPVWAEAYRVLRPGGVLLAGFMNPVHYIFDYQKIEQQGILDVAYSIPYSDVTSLPDNIRQHYIDQGWPLEFGHTLEDQIGGQLAAGFLLSGFYEDRDPEELLSQFIPSYIATRAVKPAI